MSDLKQAYEEWILNGRQGPRPGMVKGPGVMVDRASPSELPVVQGPKGMAEIPDELLINAAKHGEVLPPEVSGMPTAQPPNIYSKMAPVAAEAGSAVLGGVAGLAGLLGAAHMANPPELNANEDAILHAYNQRNEQKDALAKALIAQKETEIPPEPTALPAAAPPSPGYKASGKVIDSMEKLKALRDSMMAPSLEAEAERRFQEGQNARKNQSYGKVR